MRGEVEFRRAVVADALLISGLIQSLAHHRSLDQTEPASEAFSADFSSDVLKCHLLSTSYDYLVAIVGRSVIGVLGVRGKCSIHHFFTSEPFQVRGIGRALWEKDGSLFNPASGGLQPAAVVRLETGVHGAPIDLL